MEVARRVEQYRQRNATPEPKSADIGMLLFIDYEDLANQLRKMMDEGKIPD